MSENFDAKPGISPEEIRNAAASSSENLQAATEELATHVEQCRTEKTDDEVALDEFQKAVELAKQDPTRLRIYYVSERDVMRMVYDADHLRDSMLVCVRPQIPPGAVIHRVYHDWPRQAFAFIVWHFSFDPVPDGCAPPDILGFRSVQEILIVREDDGRNRIHNPQTQEADPCQTTPLN